MSKEGKIARGEIYYEKRNREGVLPANIANHAGIMSDVNAYLDSIKVPEKISKKKKEE